MKKPKFKFDGATIQKFLVLHCEKLILAAVLGVMAWLVYMGYSLPGLDADKTPSALAEKSEKTRKFIDDPGRWTVVSDDRKTEMDLEERAGRTQVPNDPGPYLANRPWRPEIFPKLSPRTDPVILPPQHLIVIPVMGPIFSNLQSEDEADPTYPAVEEETKTKRPPRKKKSPRNVAADPYGGYGPAGSGDMEGATGGYGGYPGARGSRRSARRTGSSEAAADAAGVGSYGGNRGSASAGMDSGMMGGYGSGYGAAGMGGINPESVFGYPGTYEAGVGRNGYAMVIKAVVPYQKQLEEFEKALLSSLDHDMFRDQPDYLGLLVQRAEVPANQLDADPDSLDWKSVSVKGTLAEQLGSPMQLGQWAGVPSEVVDPMYLDQDLTYPAPPFMQRDLWPLLTHPDVPLAPLASAGYEDLMRPKAPAPGGAKAPVEDVPTVPGGIVPGASGGYGDSADGGYGGYGGSGGYGGYGGMTRGMPGAMGSGPMRSGGMMGGMGPAGGYGAGSDAAYGSGYGMGGYGVGGYGDESAMAIAPPKYKLVRFTDTNVEPGKFYRYKLKVQVHDPNHPHVGYAPPVLASLDETVRKRIRALDEQDAKTPNFRTFWRESDTWSQPSEVVSLPSRSLFYAGAVAQPGMTEIVANKPRVAMSQPSAKVLASVWDPVKVVDVPVEETAYRGSVLNFTKDSKVIHPVTHEVVDFKEYKFQTGGIVGDLDGGESIPKRNRSNSAEALKSPGELLVVDDQGRLRVRHETDDIEEFRRWLVPPEPKVQAPADGAEGYGPGGYGSGGYGPAGSSDGGYGPSGGRPTRGGAMRSGSP
ncbi:MAG: hypothetical protein L0211_20005 [Planctomycetaceae bacterium]|nr:hypothetical protein [Planctomycetaceae bacterium]